MKPPFALKDSPSLSTYGAIYVRPHQRLRSVVTSANSPAPVAAKLRENLAPAPVTLQAPLSEQVPKKGNSRYISAYDDGVSEEGSDREVEVPSLPSEELKARLKKLEDLAERKVYQELVKDIAPKQDVQEPFSSYKDQLGFDLDYEIGAVLPLHVWGQKLFFLLSILTGLRGSLAIQQLVGLRSPNLFMKWMR